MGHDQIRVSGAAHGAATSLFTTENSAERERIMLNSRCLEFTRQNEHSISQDERGTRRARTAPRCVLWPGEAATKGLAAVGT